MQVRYQAAPHTVQALHYSPQIWENSRSPHPRLTSKRKGNAMGDMVRCEVRRRQLGVDGHLVKFKNLVVWETKFDVHSRGKPDSYLFTLRLDMNCFGTHCFHGALGCLPKGLWHG
jgi:hypothetical protein